METGKSGLLIVVAMQHVGMAKRYELEYVVAKSTTETPAQLIRQKDI